MRFIYDEVEEVLINLDLVEHIGVRSAIVTEGRFDIYVVLKGEDEIRRISNYFSQEDAYKQLLKLRKKIAINA